MCMTKDRMTQFLIKFAYVAVILGLIFLGFKRLMLRIIEDAKKKAG